MSISLSSRSTRLLFSFGSTSDWHRKALLLPDGHHRGPSLSHEESVTAPLFFHFGEEMNQHLILIFSRRLHPPSTLTAHYGAPVSFVNVCNEREVYNINNVNDKNTVGGGEIWKLICAIGIYIFSCVFCAFNFNH